ncbi:methyltransferase domain-containing protein [Actinomadura sp. ATCC 31491]|uniref:Methyltransferase domain-containing protein n=1 Tax=Actinomadura luzonensis TaxID=2805427 RepID=A0ABT0GAG4_9ACTN|nr:class I SAM-dependent methyltransferase [Actinomadura luzonensis]MCK2221071.1 methyltransferase domain-containing protein [Actinomadura luzonensis]
MSREPVTRQRLLDMMVTVRKTFILKAAVELGVFDALTPGPAGAAAVAGRIGADPRATRILLNGLAATGLVDVGEDGRYAPAEGADRLLVTTSPDYYGDALRLAASDYEWDALRRLADAVRKGGTVMEENAESPDFAFWLDFAELSTRNTQPIADAIAERTVAWAGSRDSLRVLDVACGHGMYGFTIARHDPRAHVSCLDWPHVLPVTLRNAERLGVAGRVARIPGDMFEAPLDGPYDLIMVNNVLHHLSHERTVELLRRMAGALAPDGRLVTVAITCGDKPPADDPNPHLFSVLMLAWTHGGEVPDAAAMSAAIGEAGFAVAEEFQLPHNPLRVFIAGRAPATGG